MGIPGQNLLRMASRLIQFQTVAWSSYVSGANDGAGNITNTYGAPVSIKASVQPVPRTMYETLGLDLQKDYYTVYTQAALQDLKRDASPDILDFGGRRFSVESNNDWWTDGWRGSLCVNIGPTP